MARRPGSIDSFTPDGRPLSIRGSNNSSNPNVFSDDYAVDTADSLNSLSRSQSITSRPESLSVIRDSPDRAVNSDSVTGLSSTVANSSPLNRTSLPEASSIPQRIVSISSHADTHRTLSTSSHFSIPRAPSPYNGPTAPSHPYGMYNQVTRASSIISDSTIRPVDSPFVPQGGPEHPYGMYQNTVPEEEDDAQLTTPLGFPVLGSSAASTSRSSGNDVGDIVGTDGHVEQLPPYSRYADNVIAKSDLDRIDRGGAVPSSTESLTPPPTTDTSSTSNIEPTPITPSTTDEELARKEGMKRKRTNRKIFGLPFWTFVIVVASVIVAALVGGVIGGIVGNRKGAEHALGSSTTTTTVWLDADPASTDGSTGSCPTGHFTLPLNQSAEVDTCIMDPLYTNTWGCLDVAKLGINVFEAPNGGPPVSVVFDDYSIRPQLFKYGPQPADFNGSAFTLAPYKDKEDDELGVALFFSVLFDKLSILPADALSPPDEKKRSVPAQQLTERQTWDDSTWLKVGDQPWYCFWNSTISEFWIFLDQDIDDLSGGSATTSTDTSTITTPSNPYYTKSPSTSHATMSLTESSTVMDPSKSTPSPSIPTKSYTNGKVKRQATQIGSSGYFPKLVKMVEKRKPHSNIQPYCQQMQVLNNWQILPIETVPTICIDESEYSPAAATSTSYGKTKRSPEEIQQMGSNCICEWFSDY